LLIPVRKTHLYDTMKLLDLPPELFERIVYFTLDRMTTTEALQIRCVHSKSVPSREIYVQLVLTVLHRGICSGDPPPSR
jgi:hypothetical protein